VLVGRRDMNKGEVKPPDYDDFKQCHEYGTIVPLYELKNQGKLKVLLNHLIIQLIEVM
jgi:hypothetical protein